MLSIKEPSIGQIRAAFPGHSHFCSLVKGCGRFLLSSVFHVTKVAFSFLIGLAYSILFMSGHDAGHDRCPPHGWLNAVLDRIAFLPSLHLHATWEPERNQRHDRFQVYDELKGLPAMRL
jgi:hypothetical protein